MVIVRVVQLRGVLILDENVSTTKRHDFETGVLLYVMAGAAQQHLGVRLPAFYHVQLISFEYTCYPGSHAHSE